MIDSHDLKSQPARIPSAGATAARGAVGAMVATAVALAVFVVIGLNSWDAVRGLQGVGICSVLGAAVGAALTGPGPRLARVLGGGMGGAVAGFFAPSSAELVYPATAQWAYIGGAFAALFALPVAAVAGGLFGLLSAMFRSRANGNTSTMDKFKEAFDE